MIILGVNNMHDASAALLIDGKLIAAAEEERFVRIKHRKGFPVQAMRYCLEAGGITINDVDVICTSWKPWVLWTRATQAVKSVLVAPELFRAKASRGMGQMRNEWAELFQFKHLIREHFGSGNHRIEFVDHHLAHAASTFYCSPFDQAAILTIDGAGEADTTVLWVGQGRQIRKVKAIRLPHSLGQFYSAITAFLGFKIQFDEYKVMGLAALGEPVYADYLRSHVVRCQTDGLFGIDPYFIDYHLARKGMFRKTTTDVFGPPRQKGEEITKQHADVAASAQTVVEEVIFHLALAFHHKTGLKNLCMAGGVAFNCVANGKLLQKTPFEDLFIQPAAGDAGGSLGAALYLDDKLTGRGRREVFRDAYLGPAFSTAECEQALKEMNISYEILPENFLVKKAAGLLADGKLICWFHGRMEWGPRALGARSLLADPRNPQMKAIINAKVKQREAFRPFAPSILAEKAHEIFDYYYHSPYMISAFPLKKGMPERIPAVAHVDQTARPQAVLKETNPRYWRLINEFYRITGIPLILNTSFNVQEPIVCTPHEAIRTFLKARADYLILEDCLATLPGQGE